MSDGRVRAGRWPRVSLGAMAIVVVGAAAYSGLVRESRGFWMGWVTPPMLDWNRVVGVAILLPATFLAIRLLSDAGRRPRRVVPVACRLVGVASLIGIGLFESARLQDDRDAVNFGVLDRSTWQVRLATYALAIALAGVLLGVVPRRARRGRARRAWVGASLVAAGAVGLTMLVVSNDALIAYLVVLALEAVKNAASRPGLLAGIARFDRPAPAILLDPALWRPLHERIMAAGLVGALGVLIAGLTAHWLGRDLRRPRAPTSTALGLGYRATTAVATWAIGAYLALVALPGLSVPLVEGFAAILRPGWTITLGLALFALAAGLAARGLAGESPVSIEPGDGPGARPGGVALVLVRSVVALALAMIILAAVDQRLGGETAPWYVPVPLNEWLGVVARPLTIKRPSATYLDPQSSPEVLALIVAAASLMAIAARYLVSASPEPHSPIDRLDGSPGGVVRLLGVTVALLGVILTLIPALGLAGLALLDLAVNRG